MNLKDYRDEIDAIDAKLIELFEQRMSVCAKIAQYKIDSNMPVLDQSREDAKMEKLKTMMSDEMKEYGESLYSCLFKLSRDYQSKLIKGNQGTSSRNKDGRGHGGFRQRSAGVYDAKEI